MDLHHEVTYTCIVDEVHYTCNLRVFFPPDYNFFHPGPPPSDDRYFDVLFIRIQREWQVPHPTLTSSTTDYDLLNTAEMSIEECITRVLLCLDIPQEVHSFMFTTLSEVARNKASTTPGNFNPLYMDVEICVETFSWPDEGDLAADDDDYDEAVEASMEDQHHLWTPASKSSIESLERVNIEREEEDEGLSECRICLENFEVGVEAIRMPCSHLFHSSCILEWLKLAHVCPLCRFQLPPTNDG